MSNKKSCCNVPEKEETIQAKIVQNQASTSNAMKIKKEEGDENDKDKKGNCYIQNSLKQARKRKLQRQVKKAKYKNTSNSMETDTEGNENENKEGKEISCRNKKKTQRETEVKVDEIATKKKCNTSEDEETLEEVSFKKNEEDHLEYIERVCGRSKHKNFGSEEESGSSGDEGTTLAVPVSRVYRFLMDTLEDDSNAAPSPSPIADSTASPGATAHDIDYEVFSDVVFDATSEVIEVVPDIAFENVHKVNNMREPTTFFDFKWRPFPNPPIPPESRREIFSHNSAGPNTPLFDPYDLFTAIWDSSFMEHIVTETNRYAQHLALQMLKNNDLLPQSRIAQWRDTSSDELFVYFAIIMTMGVVIKTNIVEYWSSNSDIFCTPGFRAYMPLRRFQLLSRCLHFNNNSNMCVENMNATDAKLYKIAPVINHLNKKFSALYSMRQNIALDESLLLWKGWLDTNKFIPDKESGVGIKAYEICESQSGYLWRFEIGAYKKAPDPLIQPSPLSGSIPTTVLRLLQGLEHKGHTVWMDNVYNSPALARKLKTLGFDCVGTLRTNRQLVPREMSLLTKENMRPGEVVGCTSGDVDILVWRDQGRVAMISTYHGNVMSFNKDDSIAKPIIVCDYNICMGGVDKKDQMLASFPIERGRTRVWYKKIFRRLLNVSVQNAYIIHKNSPQCPKILKHRAFRIQLILDILHKHYLSSRSGISFLLPSADVDCYDLRVHYPAEYDFLPANKSRLRRKCWVCRKRTTSYCAGCIKPVCVFTCFTKLHS